MGRSQCYATVAIPIPNHVSPEAVIAFIQTYRPILRHNPSIVSFEKVVSRFDAIGNDSFFGPWDDTVCTFQVREVITLAPGLTKDMSWPMIFQCIPDGIRFRGDAAVGVVAWNRMVVRPRQQVMSPCSSEGSTPSDVAEEWELLFESTVEANRLLMPFITGNTENFLRQICEGLVDEIGGAAFHKAT
ncbi:hypothetical protein AK830_g5721 [Neonectria ditissima]|uniref:DUF7053 domain-containing protein n=1 Tax=Neonectria ditissima TaxID=78410 RepID=A0A0P7ASR8_9HYPO|nr:hypothetical protein AK830_g5721 [Neonectria ditissima]